MPSKISSRDKRPTRSVSNSGVGNRDYAAISAISAMADNVAVGVEEISAITGLSTRTIQQRRITGFPQPIPGIRCLRWRLGAIRDWLHSGEHPMPATRPTPRARGVRRAY